MFGSEALEVAFGITFVFLMVSVICSAIREGIEAWFKTRAAFLEYGIRELLHDTSASELTKTVFEHPLIYGLFSRPYTPAKSEKRPRLLANGNNLPSYIPARNFAMALMDIAARGPQINETNSEAGAPLMSVESIRTNVMNIKNPAVQRILLIALDSSEDDLNVMQKNLEEWYNSGMDRVSGWYKRSTSWMLFWIGLSVSILLNINIITIANYLYKDGPARRVLVARAEEAAKDTNLISRSYEQARQELTTLELPMGWEKNDSGLLENVRKGLLGWLLTALAVTMGAPFWFDILNKFMVIRSTVKPHEKSQEEASEDRQLPQKPNRT